MYVLVDIEGAGGGGVFGGGGASQCHSTVL